MALEAGGEMPSFEEYYGHNIGNQDSEIGVMRGWISQDNGQLKMALEAAYEAGTKTGWWKGWDEATRAEKTKTLARESGGGL